MKGKEKCRMLRQIRQEIAKENGIEYITQDCTYQGDCKGTCPKCESELRYLEQEIEKRRALGKQVAIAALAAGIAASTAACSRTNHQLEGDVPNPMPVTEEFELEGDPVERDPTDTEMILLEGEVPMMLSVTEETECPDGALVFETEVSEAPCFLEGDVLDPGQEK